MLSKKMCLFYDSMIIGKATFIPSIILRSLIFNELTTNHNSIKVVRKRNLHRDKGIFAIKSKD